MFECVPRAERVVRALRNYTGWIKIRSSKPWNFLLFIATVVFFARLARTQGLSLGASLVCAGTPGLTDKQRAMCRASPAAIAAVGDGLRMAYAECRTQLAGARWNCSGVGEGNIFGHVMPLATREAAFTYAITSAGVAHALSAACAKGELEMCSCRRHANSRRRLQSANEQFQGGGCGAVAYGVRFARRFLDARELETDARSACNLHNNRVGRKLVKDLVRPACKCHGVSGSCAMKTCWRVLPSFKAVATELKNRYMAAKMVAQHPPHAPNTHLVIKRSKPHAGVGRQPRKTELVFLQPSPPYCEPDPEAGVLGTHGRHCNRTSRGEDGCETLCCGRGYNTVRTVLTEQCHCKFNWCCHVSCKMCTRPVDTHICN